MAHFYLLDELATTAVGERVTLSGSEGHHAVAVSRVRVGESLHIGNGRGLMLDATAVVVEKASVVLEVTAMRLAEAPSPRITLVQALAKNDRDERAIEACTELGIDAIIPWAADRSISKWEGPKVAKSRSRWLAIVREATKQSIRPYVPEILNYEKTSAALKTVTGQLIIVLDPTGDVALSDVKLPDSEASDAVRDIALVVGPEGGITDSELALFRASGAVVATLGNNILRTSTAGPAALAIVGSRLRRL